MNKAKDGLLISLLAIVFAAGGFVYNDYRRGEMLPVANTDGALRLPAELHITPNEFGVYQPVVLRADTIGPEVIFRPLDQEISVSLIDKKSAWVGGSKPGKYRIMAWTAVGGHPTLAEDCNVIVDAIKAAAEKTEPVARQP